MEQPYLFTYYLASGLWGLIGIIWILFTFTNKQTVQKEGVKSRFVVLALLIVGYFIAFSQHVPLPVIGYTVTVTPTIGWIGVFVTACGATLAIWARFVIGRNWSGAGITLKKDHQLVRTGAYSIVRHPIYSGLLLAAVGLVITEGVPFDFVGVILVAIAFLIRIPKEEKLMTEQFPNEYPEYKKKAKALIPFVW